MDARLKYKSSHFTTYQSTFVNFVVNK